MSHQSTGWASHLKNPQKVEFFDGFLPHTLNQAVKTTGQGYHNLTQIGVPACPKWIAATENSLCTDKSMMNTHASTSPAVVLVRQTLFVGVCGKVRQLITPDLASLD